MKLLIVSTAPFISIKDDIYAYSPYVNELVIWEKYADEIIFCCPVWGKEKGLLVDKIPFKISAHYRVSDFNINSFVSIIKSPLFALYSVLVLFKSMQQADHIHLRCPGNIGLLGCIVQILFPYKQKSAKYAGNWDPKSKQPWTYRLQQWILSNTFFTRNMQVLVYGQWEGSSSNIKPFFTATYADADKVPLRTKSPIEPIRFVFVGSLVPGKRSLYAIQLVEVLYKKGLDVALTLYGEGTERKKLEDYIHQNNLENRIVLQGNQPQNVIQKGYQESHFVILPSQSEGWPKVIAEGMFWGCVPIATAVSCVPFMLDQGNRGVLLTMNLEKDVKQIEAIIEDEVDYQNRRKKATEWSRKYTLDFFEQEIKKLIQTK
jgi:glycosyltransferase involved in cell wall biosynthesis